jgi:hypothetical protein
LEQGGAAPVGDQLFDRSVFKAALPAVSDARLNQYLFAEYPDQREYVERLIGGKTEQTPESLAKIWGIPSAEAIKYAQELIDLGFFQKRGSREEPTYWVPFLYRDSLHMVQGLAEEE